MDWILPDPINSRVGSEFLQYSPKVGPDPLSLAKITKKPNYIYTLLPNPNFHSHSNSYFLQQPSLMPHPYLVSTLTLKSQALSQSGHALPQVIKHHATHPNHHSHNQDPRKKILHQRIIPNPCRQVETLINHENLHNHREPPLTC